MDELLTQTLNFQKAGNQTSESLARIGLELAKLGICDANTAKLFVEKAESIGNMVSNITDEIIAIVKESS